MGGQRPYYFIILEGPSSASGEGKGFLVACAPWNDIVAIFLIFYSSGSSSPRKFLCSRIAQDSF